MKNIKGYLFHLLKNKLFPGIEHIVTVASIELLQAKQFEMCNPTINKKGR